MTAKEPSPNLSQSGEDGAIFLAPYEGLYSARPKNGADLSPGERH